jgi:alkylation response protein AidB-like acyl-CoA dehydrogenase
MSDVNYPTSAGPTLVSPLSAALGFSEIIGDIAATAAERERGHRLPHEEIAKLKALGFGALRLPVDAGGSGVSLNGLFIVARDLAAADSNIAHAFRNHLWQVEAALRRREQPFHTRVLELTAQKKTIGLSFVDSDVVAAGARPTKVLSRLEWDASRDVYVGSGDKIYATGNLYNDAFTGLAVESRAGRTVQYVLERGAGVDDDDDWQGFGQRLTG